MKPRDIINICLFALIALAFIFCLIKIGTMSLNMKHIEQALQVERIARQGMARKLSAIKDRPNINIKYGTVISTNKEIKIAESKK